MFSNQDVLRILQLQAMIFCTTNRAKQGLDMWDVIDSVELGIMRDKEI